MKTRILPSLKNRKKWLMFHAALGLLSAFSMYPFIAWFYISLLSGMVAVLRAGKGKHIQLMGLICYLVSFEGLDRMIHVTPYIPYELGKYTMIVLFTFGIFLSKKTRIIGWFMLFLLIPSLFIDKSHQADFHDIQFSFWGPLAMTLGIIYCYKKKVRMQDFRHFLYLIFLPMATLLIESQFDTSSLYVAADFQHLFSNHFTSGRWLAPNQYSIFMGIGMLLMFLSWLKRWKFTGYRWLDVLAFGAFFYKGLISYSRGGVIGGILAVLVVVFYLMQQSERYRILNRVPKITRYIIPVVIAFGSVFFIVNQVTNGGLSERYQGETKASQLGVKQINANSLSAGRLAIFEGDFMLFAAHPVFGVGVGASQYLRPLMKGWVPHIELSRLAAEQGIFGLTFFVLLLVIGLRNGLGHKNPFIRGTLLSVFILAIYTTGHNAMRTFVTPLLVSISLLSVYYNPLKERQQRIKVNKQRKVKAKKKALALEN